MGAREDHDEMAALLKTCRSKRIRQELQPWLSQCEGRLRVERAVETPALDPADMLELGGLIAACRRPRLREELQKALAAGALELRRDREEMASLLAASARQARLRPALQPWLDARKEGSSEAPGAVPKAASEGAPPLVLVLGASGTGHGRLLAALAGKAGESVKETGRISTKYYSARVRYVAVTVPSEDCSAATAKEAAAIVALWDTKRPETFSAVRDSLQELLGDEEEEEDDERVQVCVAADAPSLTREQEEAEEEARVWCATHCFEHLRCSVGEKDLEGLRSAGSASIRLLGDDEEDSLLRVMEALQCRTWPEVEEDALDAASPCVEAPQEPASLVLVAGAPELGGEKLLEALAGATVKGGSAECVLETKYYTARLRFAVADLQGRLVEAPEGVVLLCDPGKPETVAEVRGWYEREVLPTLDGADFKLVRLCVSVGGADEGLSQWCAENCVELVECPLSAGNLEKLREQFRKCKGKPLLAPEEDDAVSRIVEGLQCHTWTSLQLSSSKAAAAAPVEVAAEKVQAEEEDISGASAVDTLERFAGEIRQVREISDEGERRNRACDVAMQLARSLGVDDSDDEEA